MANNNTNNNGLAEFIVNAKNGYVRDRKHEKVAVYEVKQAILSCFATDNHLPIVYAVGNWMVCAGYAIMNRSDAELLAIADRVVTLSANGVHITAKNSKNNATLNVFSSSRVKAALYRAMECDFAIVDKKHEEKPTVTERKNNGKTSKKEQRVIRIMEKFGCDRATAEEMAM